MIIIYLLNTSLLFVSQFPTTSIIFSKKVSRRADPPLVPKKDEEKIMLQSHGIQSSKRHRVTR